MIINGVDITIYFILLVTVTGLAMLEYFICLKAANPSMRKVLFFIPFIIFVIALIAYGSESGGGFIDLSGLISFLIICYGLICTASIGLGWLIYYLKHRNRTPDSCPFDNKEIQ